jgi:hypothetical protein
VTTRAVWVDEQLARSRIERTGELEPYRDRPWATVFRAPTSAGTVWLKVAGRGTAFEASLYELLADVVPDRVLDPLGVDAERGWVLLPDGGPPLGSALEGHALLEALLGVVPRYAALQLRLAPHVDRMLAAGVPDMRPAAMPRRFEEALAGTAPYVEARGTLAERATWERIIGLRGEVGEWAARLAQFPGPASVDHNDLHPWNVLAGEQGGFGQPRFYDWGDSVVAHPFASMLLPLGFVERALLDSTADRRPVRRVRDAYLEPFGDLAPHEELIDALELACRLGKVARTLTWLRALEATDPDTIDTRWTSAPFETLASLLGDAFLG